MSSFIEPWYKLVINDGVTPDLPGIYEWRIDGIGSYIGKYTHSRRSLKEYAKHVRSQFTGGKYRPANPNGWRRIHVELYRACLEKRDIELIFVENCSLTEINKREQHYIALRGSLNGSRLPIAPSPQTEVVTMSRDGDDFLNGLAYRIGIWAQLCDGYDVINRHATHNKSNISFGGKFLDDIFFLMDLVEEGDRLRLHQAIEREMERHAKVEKDFAENVIK